jgi:hypothetical protein
MPTARFFWSAFFPPLFALLLLTVISPVVAVPRQDRKATISITIDPRETTVHVGQKFKFSAVVHGGDLAVIRWAVDGQGGGSISQDGLYTAPRVIGIYYVVALATRGDTAVARAIAKVTVVTEYDTPPLPVQQRR